MKSQEWQEVTGHLRQWTLPGTSLDLFIQSGGCVEIGETDWNTGEREFIHLCPHTWDAVRQALEWGKEVQDAGRGDV